jgi:hypothetical protein
MCQLNWNDGEEYQGPQPGHLLPEVTGHSEATHNRKLINIEIIDGFCGIFGVVLGWSLWSEGWGISIRGSGFVRGGS